VALLGSISLAAISIVHEEAKSIHIISGTLIPQHDGDIFDADGETILLESVDFSVSGLSFHAVPWNRFTLPRPIRDAPSLERYQLRDSSEPECFYVKISCSGFFLELRDSSGAALGRVALQTLSRMVGYEVMFAGVPLLSSARVGAWSVVMDQTYFEGYIFDPPDYASYAIFRNGVELAVVERSAHAPVAAIAGISKGQAFEENDYIELSLSAWDADGDNLVYDIFLTEEADDYGVFNTTMTRDVVPSEKVRIPSSEFMTTDTARIGISVSDGTRSAFVETPVFSLADRPPKVQIISPAQNEKPAYLTCPGSSTSDSFDCIVFGASGKDPDDNSGLSNSSYSWASNIDGHLGTSRSLRIPINQISYGEHTITVTFTNDQGESATDSVDIVIDQKDMSKISDN